MDLVVLRPVMNSVVQTQNATVSVVIVSPVSRDIQETNVRNVSIG